MIISVVKETADGMASRVKRTKITSNKVSYPQDVAEIREMKSRYRKIYTHELPPRTLSKKVEASIEGYGLYLGDFFSMSPITVKANKRDIKFANQFFSVLRPTQMELSILVSLLKDLGRTNKRVNNLQYSILYFQQYLGKDFTVYLKKKESSAEQHVPEDWELKMLHDYINSIPDPAKRAFLEALITVLEYTGARDGEVSILNIEDITDNAIFIRKPEKGEPARAIPVDGKPIEVIRNYIKYFRMRTDQRALFTGPSGRINSDALRTRVKRLCTNAGVPRLHTPIPPLVCHYGI